MLIMAHYKEKWQRRAYEEGLREGFVIGFVEEYKKAVEEAHTKALEEALKIGLEEGRKQAEAKYAETIRRLKQQLRERDNANCENCA